MNVQVPNNVEKSSKLDRWGLVPVRRGFLRGRAKNIRFSEGVGPYGQIIVLDFDLWSEDGSPNVPVHMSGTDFQGRLTDMSLIDVKDPDPSVRPINTDCLWDAGAQREKVTAQYPGKKILPLPRDPRWQALFVVVPAVSLLLLAVIFYIAGILG